jgi:hypothetical protein
MLNANAVGLEIWVQLTGVEAEAEVDLDSPAELQVTRRAKAKAREPPARHCDSKFRASESVNFRHWQVEVQVAHSESKGPSPCWEAEPARASSR